MAQEETVGVGGDSREAVSALERLRDKAVQVSRSLGSMAAEATLTGLAVVGLDNVVAVLQRTVQFANDSITAFVETNRAAGVAANSTSQAYRSFQVAVGNAALGSGNADIIFGALNRTLGQMSVSVAQNEEQLQALTREAMADALEVLAATADAVSTLTVAYELGKDAIVAYNEALAWAVSNLPPFALAVDAVNLAQRAGVDIVGEANEALDDYIEANVEASSGAGLLRSAAEMLAAGMRESAAMVRDNETAWQGYIYTTRQAIEQFALLDALFGNAQTVEPPRPVAPTARSANTDVEDEEARSEALLRLRQQFIDAWDAMNQAAKERGTEATQRELDVLEQLRQKDLEFQQAANEAKIADNEKLLRAELDAQARRAQVARDSAASAASLVSELAKGQGKALDVIKSFLGQELSAKGQALMIEGAATMIVPGMQGVAALKIAAGTMLNVAGARLSRQGGGGGGTAVETGGAPIPASSAPQSSATVTQQVSFGIVGDPRAAAALVSDATRTAMREGMRGAA